MSPAPEARVVLVTAPDAATASRLARALVEERLAACVNIVPGVRSIYRWEGRVHEDPEWLLVIKTRAGLGGALAARVRELHPATLPEVLELPASGGSDAYLAWIGTETTP